jgi:hypothetical protein
MAGTLMLGAAIRRLNGEIDFREDEAAVVRPLDLNDTSAGDVVRLADTGAKLLDKALAISSPDFHGVKTVSGAAVYDLTRSLLELAVEALEDGMRAAVSAHGDFDSLVLHHQNRLLNEASTLYSRARPRESTYWAHS